ncbi:28800_t:CDS:2 [Gigaspora margarita]|uniref:28800_t:CDS:1 n=1 Tax=Gigaspora margarita TaxID=4874 RepID=A0ABN7W8P8_GIGMA|nr:28800_t:CDS:2 [Gigaspora margarita]
MESEDQDQSIDSVNENNRLIGHDDGDICISNIDIIVSRYAKQNRFVAIKYRLELDAINKMIIRQYVYKYWKARAHSSKKIEDINSYRNSATGRTNCPWQASFNFGKCATEICLTKIIDSHNHLCDSKTIELAFKNLRFLQNILDKIKHYTTNGYLNAGQQYSLLLTEFPEHNIKKKNLYNAIQKFWGVQIHDATDTAKMFFILQKSIIKILGILLQHDWKDHPINLLGFFG